MHLVNYNFFPVLKRLHFPVIDLGKGLARGQQGQSVHNTELKNRKIENYVTVKFFPRCFISKSELGLLEYSSV